MNAGLGSGADGHIFPVVIGNTVEKIGSKEMAAGVEGENRVWISGIVFHPKNAGVVWAGNHA